MVNKRTRASTSRPVKRKSNPLYRQAAGPSRPRIGFDGNILQVTTFSATPTTGTDALGYQIYKVDADDNDSVGQDMSAVTGLYDTFKYLSCTFHYEPSTGPASTQAPARIHISYTDNPEKFNVFVAASNAVKLSIARGLKNTRTYNAWERFTYPVPLTSRRKMFDVNQTDDLNENTLDRSVQGFVMIVVESIGNNAASFGVWRIQSTCMLHGLNKIPAT